MDSVKEKAFKVAFYPEGGTIVKNTACRIAFKAEDFSGVEESISGEIVDSRGNVIQVVKTLYKGLGYFDLYPNDSTDYYLECKNKEGIAGRFVLPASRGDRYGMKLGLEKERLLVSVIQPEYMRVQDSLYLVLQSGDSLVYGDLWDSSKKYLTMAKEVVRPGLSSFILLDKKGSILCGRSFFDVKDRLSLQALSPDQRMYILPILNELGSDPSRKDQVLDILAQTLSIEKVSQVPDEQDPGIWKNVDLGEVVIRAFKKDKLVRNMYQASISTSRTVTIDEIEKWRINDMRSLLSLFSGVEFRIDYITRRYYVVIRQVIESFQVDYEGRPLVVIDDMPFENFEILDYPVTDVEEIFLLKGTDAVVFGPKARNGVIVIMTKRGKFMHGGDQRK